MKIVATYDPQDGIAVPDGKCEEYWSGLVSRAKNMGNVHKVTVIVGTETMLASLRLLVGKEPEISDASIVYSGKIIELKKQGKLCGYDDFTRI